MITAFETETVGLEFRTIMEFNRIGSWKQTPSSKNAEWTRTPVVKLGIGDLHNVTSKTLTNLLKKPKSQLAAAIKTRSG
ncbi:MAG: hypothetical protein R2788_19215 [Saprospiraceae bacterium]